MKTENLPSRKAHRIGWGLSGFAILFLVFDIVGKFLKPEAVIKGTVELGYPETIIGSLGVILLVCTLLYTIPRTSFFGALLLTGYLGGAIATHVRIGNPLFSHVLFPIYVALFIWIGLYLRSAKLRDLVALK
ncbi:DoxX family protein [Chryseotalea sanaruensis]|uniref:DoxX family protein n=1 Tax=Chryseotalea sanaruensis TaxID=2482724 RepID=A0A401UA36_9BACT|nr:DoxX family protein [Chryseotalea sanaruensis]GCC51732.1 DoxX family protein [Chryseotalea sanaruensis]